MGVCSLYVRYYSPLREVECGLLNSEWKINQGDFRNWIFFLSFNLKEEINPNPEAISPNSWRDKNNLGINALISLIFVAYLYWKQVNLARSQNLSARKCTNIKGQVFEQKPLRICPCYIQLFEIYSFIMSIMLYTWEVQVVSRDLVIKPLSKKQRRNAEEIQSKSKCFSFFVISRKKIYCN